jgi:N-carbamoylputrescine amidase
MTDTLNVGLVQQACGEKRAQNLAATVAGVREAAAEGAQLVLLQELHTGVYFCQTEDARRFDQAEAIPGPTTDELGALAKELGVVIVASLFERRAAGLYHNTAVVLERDGSVAGRYRKMHIPDDPGYYEKFYFTPGDTGFRAWKTRYATIGVLVCWDQWFPEGARLTAMQGAEILFYPTAIGWHPSEKKAYGRAQHESWEVVQRSHAVTNGCFVCAPNRVGVEHVLDAVGRPVNKDGIQFWGQSFIAGPDGQVIERASSDQHEVLIVDCDLERVNTARTHWPFLRDRRIDAYDNLSRRFTD